MTTDRYGPNVRDALRSLSRVCRRAAGRSRRFIRERHERLPGDIERLRRTLRSMRRRSLAQAREAIESLPSLEDVSEWARGTAARARRLPRTLREIDWRAALDPETWRSFALTASDWLRADRGRRGVAAGVIAASLVMTPALLRGSSATPTPLPARPGERLEVIAYFENQMGDIFPDSFPTLKRNRRSVDVISPFWYSISLDGEVIDRGSRPAVTRYARRTGIEVVPLFNNVRKAGTDNAQVLVDAALRRRAIASVTDVVRKNGYDGVNLDFEALPPSAREPFGRFVEELAAALHRMDEVLFVSVFPKIGVSEDVHGAYDYERLARSADRVIVMGYDYHWLTSPPGPISPTNWVEANLRYALERVPADHLVLGIGTYGYDWRIPFGPGEYIPTREALGRARRHGATVRWDGESENAFYRYRDDGARHEVWYQDAASVSAKLAVSKRLCIRGVAVWRMGLGEAGTWDVIGEFSGG